MLEPGIYRHYKGGEYEVVGIARLEATHEEVVVYRALYGEKQLWVRPLTEFCSTVEIEGQSMPRFVKV